MGVTVLVLQPFTVQGGTTGGAAEQEAFGHRIGTAPDHVADPLEAEDRIEDVERNHRRAEVGVGGAGGQERGHRAGFADPLLQQLAVFGFLIGQQRAGIHRLVFLSFAGVDPELIEQRLHPEGTGLIRDDRDDIATQRLVFHHRRQHAHKGHGGGLLPRGSLDGPLEQAQRRSGQARLLGGTAGEVTVELLPLPMQVESFRTVFGRLVEGRLGQLLIGHRNTETAADGDPIFGAELLLLMRGVLAFGRGAHAFALDRFHQDHRGLAGITSGSVEGGVEFLTVMTATTDQADLIIVEGLHQLGQTRVTVDPVLAHGFAVGDSVELVIAIHGAVHPRLQQSVLIAGEQFVPLAAPDHLDYIPAGTAVAALQLLDDLAVAPDRAVEPLQVAVDHHHQVVEIIAGRHVDGAEHFRFVRFAVTDKAPDLTAVGRFDAAVFQVLHKPGLVDRRGGGEAHRGAGQLPEVR